MNAIFKFNPSRPKLWHRKKPHQKPLSRFLFLFVSSLLLFLFFYISYTYIPKSIFSVSRLTPKSQIPQCTTIPKERFLWYAPHSGFSNQLSEFKNAILMAGILNRTVVVPPILDHHAVALGSCPKFRVLVPNEIRMAVWDQAIDLIRSRRYVSMADIVDISSLVSSSAVQAMDFRVFVSLWCGVDPDFGCFEKLGFSPSLLDRLKQCGSLLSGLDGNTDNCVYSIQEDCRTTVWTYQQDEDGTLDPFQPDKQLKKRKKMSYVRKRKDVYKTLGPGSKAESAGVLAFPSLFTAPYKKSQSYINILDAPKDKRVQTLIEKIKFLPFVPEILHAGKNYALDTIKAPFLCAQLRLLDGQFKNHWKATFLGLKQKLEPLRQMGPLPVHIFLMTDLPQGNWTGTYLGDLIRDTDNFKLYFIREKDPLVTQTAKNVAASGHGLKFGVSKSSDGSNDTRKKCTPQRLPDVLLYIEETVCSCASLGFVGTAGSTIAETIELMRKMGVCQI